MDWNKTKTIFIIVFSILNVFLYIQYLESYTEGQNVEELGEKNVEAKLKEDGITYEVLPKAIDQAAYISGKVKSFDTNMISSKKSYTYQIENGHTLIATLKSPYPTDKITEESLKQFVQTQVDAGASYTLWELNKKEQTALFFQQEENYTLYYNRRGFVKVYYNSRNEIYMYEQAMLEDLEKLDRQKNLLPPIQVIHALYARNLLKSDSHVTSMKLGYSTVVQLTQTQVLVPTWEVHVKTADGHEEEYFVNAVEGKVIDMQLEVEDLEE